MNIVIIGAGALGVYFGGRLQEVGENVTFLVRERRATELREHGLAIKSIKGDYPLPNVSYTTDVQDIDSADIVLLAVKGYHLDGTLPQLKTLVQKGAKVIPLLNGIEHIDTLQTELGEENVIGGLAFIIATLDKKGHVVHTSEQHRFVFGPLHSSQEQLCEQFHEITNKANMENELHENILTSLWNKYMFITAFSGITTATNLPIGPIRDNDQTLQVAKDTLLEMKRLANGYDALITEDHVENAVNLLFQFPNDGTSSMHQDKRKGLTIEVDHLHGGALRLAKKIGIELPVIKTIHGVIKPYEHGSPTE
ncbi:ketopantoate reductase family protein [Salirhabdus salicampi]|nr:ketopantoate reductase family protein [Salirhabdus salicampi]MCP8617897.1 ketopantoate reductase family protein [Salirhabdus salicampi]